MPGWFHHQTGAIVSGITAGPVCYFGIQLKHMLGYDDALDAFGVHGIGGIWGGIITGLMADPKVAGPAGAFFGNPKQLGIQIAGIVVTMAFSFIMTLLIIVPLDLILKATTGKGVRVSEEAEDIGLDLSEHGESMINMGGHNNQVTHFDGSKPEPLGGTYSSENAVVSVQVGS